MPVQMRLDAEYAALLNHSIVQSTELIRYTVNRLDGYLRIRAVLVNGDFLEIALHITLHNDNVVIDSYRYQWMDSMRTNLRRRWDDTPHFPQLPGFPHHCHVKQEDHVEPATLMDVKTLLNVIAQNLI
jgi:hypothetical protein